MIKEIGGERIGIIGYTTKDTPMISNSGNHQIGHPYIDNKRQFWNLYIVTVINIVCTCSAFLFVTKGIR